MKILDLARWSRGRAVSVMMRARPSHLSGLALLLGAMLAVTFFAACGDGPTEPPPDPPRATTITVSPATADLAALGTTVQLSAEVRDQNRQVMAGAAVTWASSTADVATVNASGLVTAAANGSATITATSGSASGSATVTVMQSADAVAVQPAEASFAALGDTLRLTAEALDANGQVVAGAAVTWASSDAAVATVGASGLVTAVANGSATVTATSGSASGSATVTVAQEVRRVAVTPDTASLGALGDIVRLSAEAFDANGSAVAGAEFSWESSDEAVATVDAAGLVTAVANGSATITAASGPASGGASVTVAQEVSAVAVTPDAATVVEGDTLRLAATATDANGHDAAGIEFVWASGNRAVAVVDASGLATGVGAGQTMVSATTAGTIGRAQLTVVLRVPTAVAVAPGSVVLTAPGQTERLTAEVRDQIGRVMEDQSIVWASNDSMVATVSASGLVRAVANGTTKITATAGDASGSATVTVAQSGPDLVVELLTDSPFKLQTDDVTHTLAFRVRNRGDATAPWTWLRYYLSPDPAIGTDDTEVPAADSVWSLWSGRTKHEWVTVTVPSKFGRYYYGACLDPVPRETDLGNNCSAALTVIGLPRGKIVARDEQSLTIQLSTSPETRVELYRSASLTGDYQLVDGNIPALDDVTYHVDDALRPNTIYYYNAKLCRNAVCSGFSAAWGGVTEVVGTVEVPPTPTRVQGERVPITWATDDARLWWVPAPRATYYEVYERNRLDAEVSSPATSYYDGKPDSFLGIFTTTSYRVKACNKAGCSAYSAEVWVR